MGVAGVVLLLSGCASTGRYCDPSDERNGAVCYDGINFGKNADPLYRSGVRDGCETGKGYYSKNYGQYRSSEAYRLGWDRGRTLCRPPGWNEETKKKPRQTAPSRDFYHPASLPHEEERRRVIRAFPETSPRVHHGASLDTPEVLSYD